MKAINFSYFPRAISPSVFSTVATIAVALQNDEVLPTQKEVRITKYRNSSLFLSLYFDVNLARIYLNQRSNSNESKLATILRRADACR